MADYDNSRHIFENCHSLNPMCLSAFQPIIWQYGNSFHRHRSHPLGGWLHISTTPQARRRTGMAIRAAGVILAKQQSRGCRHKRIALNINYLSSPIGNRNTKALVRKALVFNTLTG